MPERALPDLLHDELKPSWQETIGWQNLHRKTRSCSEKFDHDYCTEVGCTGVAYEVCGAEASESRSVTYPPLIVLYSDDGAKEITATEAETIPALAGVLARLRERMSEVA